MQDDVIDYTLLTLEDEALNAEAVLTTFHNEYEPALPIDLQAAYNIYMKRLNCNRIGKELMQSYPNNMTLKYLENARVLLLGLTNFDVYNTCLYHAYLYNNINILNLEVSFDVRHSEIEFNNLQMNQGMESYTLTETSRHKLNQLEYQIGEMESLIKQYFTPIGVI